MNWEELDNFINEIALMDEEDYIGHMCYFGSCDAARKGETIPSFVVDEIKKRREAACPRCGLDCMCWIHCDNCGKTFPSCECENFKPEL